MPFKDNLQRLMDARHWQPVHLAAAVCDIGGQLLPVTIKRWLSGECNPHSASIYLVAQALGVTPNDLLLDADAAQSASSCADNSLPLADENFNLEDVHA